MVISAFTGAPVSINANALLKISSGTFEAGGTADPFTDTVSRFSMSIQNDSTAKGFVVSAGTKTVNLLYGVGDTYVCNPGTVLNATSIVQRTLTIGGPAPSPEPAGVPEPSALLLLILAAICGANVFAGGSNESNQGARLRPPHPLELFLALRRG